MYLVALLYSYFSLMKFPQFVADQKKKKKLLVRVSFKILNFTSGEGLKRIVLTTFISNSS